MKVILDTNVFFSALIKPDGKIAEILLNPSFQFEKYTCYYLYVEIFKHKNKILRISKLEEEELLEVLYALLRKIEFVNEFHIPKANYVSAYNLAKDVDADDTPFIALTNALGGYYWTGDRKIYNSLRSRGYENVISTDDLSAWTKLIYQ